MEKKYFSELIPELSLKSKNAIKRHLNINNQDLSSYVSLILSASPGSRNNFINDMVFEATYGWQISTCKMCDLSGHLLNENLLQGMDAPYGTTHNEYRFAKDYHPYSHQLQSWEILSKQNTQSIVVTSGTGSGKTECFLVPILSDLANQLSDKDTPLVGVQALLIYPLNALIESQRQRLDAWTYKFGKNLRFCLYNGQTPQTELKTNKQNKPNQVLDRESLKRSPPPILVTNATMLEYMLVRKSDQAILSSSQGKLKWIVLDEAHTYLGAKAAELTLLLKRVMLAFGVNSEQVHFIATSATLGGLDSEKQLQQFLASVSGVSLDRVHVIKGQRHIPKLPRGQRKYRDATYQELLAVDEKNLYQALSANNTALALRNQFVLSRPHVRKLSLLNKIISSNSVDNFNGWMSLLEWLDLLTSAKSIDGQPFLPLRLHVFYSLMNGLWACVNSECYYKDGVLKQSWPFGAVYLHQKSICKCDSPIYEIRTCSCCHEVYLWANQSFVGGDAIISQANDNSDDFSLDMEKSSVDEEEVLLSYNYQHVEPILIMQNGMSSEKSEFLESISFKQYGKKGAKTLFLDVRHQSKGKKAIITCPQCQKEHSIEKPLFRSLRVGAPFIQEALYPTLLEYSTDQIVSDHSLPHDGHRLIAFSDSRQGTARTALRCQQDAEKKWLQSEVYHYLLKQQQHQNTDKTQAILFQLDDLKQRYQTVVEHMKPLIQALIRANQSQLALLQSPQVISYKSLVNFLKSTTTFKNHIFTNYQEKMPNAFQGDNTQTELAQILLLREFARRPITRDNLETLGLVAIVYPKLERIKKLPEFMDTHGEMTLLEWQSFLKLILDYFMRDYSAMKLPKMWSTWSGVRIPSKLVVSPHSHQKNDNKKYIAWPTITKQSIQAKIVRLLITALKSKIYFQKKCVNIQGLLTQAFDALIGVRLLQPCDNGWYLDPEDMAFILPKNLYICPVTNKKLDTTLRQITPLTPRAVHLYNVTCQQIQMPVYRPDLRDSTVDQKQLIKVYLEDNLQVQSLRAAGHWHDLHDNVLMRSPYYRIEEHSAQQDATQLKNYEQGFREGKVNILSCSTTMEMGVDIGGVSVVVMNNVPPHPANYLQRAGRAGRRRETRSVVFTLCKNNPHDQYVLNRPLWPFMTPMPSPRVSLNSEVLVQRHINAYLLAYFFRESVVIVDSILKLDVEWWIFPPADSPAKFFVKWLSELDEKSLIKLSHDLAFLVKRTILENRDVKTIVQNTCSIYQNFDKVSLMNYSTLNAQRSPTKLDDAVVIKNILVEQEQRLLDEYLLTALVKEGVLPAYGFPTNVIVFDANKVSTVKYPQNKANKFKALPKREANIALMEYAPNAQIVIDGLVYKSEGVILNWHLPASEDALAEVQSIRQLLLCQVCGVSQVTSYGLKVKSCENCGSPSRELQSLNYLEPTGLSVDYSRKPTTDVTAQRFIKPETTLISVNDKWQPIGDSDSGSGFYRASEKGHVFHHVAGLSGYGYAVCLECGRTVEMGEKGTLLEDFLSGHMRLRGEKIDRQLCSGTVQNNVIIQNLHLGYEHKTDVLELLLLKDERPIVDKTTAFTIAVAVRIAATRILGIELNSLGCDVKEIYRVC